MPTKNKGTWVIVGTDKLLLIQLNNPILANHVMLVKCQKEKHNTSYTQIMKCLWAHTLQILSNKLLTDQFRLKLIPNKEHRVVKCQVCLKLLPTSLQITWVLIILEKNMTHRLTGDNKQVIMHNQIKNINRDLTTETNNKELSVIKNKI